MSKARAKGFRELVKVNEARETFFNTLGDIAMPSEEVELGQALGRVLAEDVVGSMDIPPFDRGAMDGYAVVAEDTFGASTSNPVLLKLVGRVEIGGHASVHIQRGEAASIVTGAPMPAGADAVVKLEYARPLRGAEVEVFSPITPGDNVSKRGEDVRRGSTVLGKGTKLRPQDIGILAALGAERVTVARQPLVAVISTGDELVDVKQPLAPGKIHDINRPMFNALVQDLACQPLDFGIASDRPEAISEKIREAIAKADVVLISAGTSVGEKDMVPDIINGLGKPGVVVHGVSLRPGAPTALAVVDGKPVILLPGFPVAAMVAFDCFVRPLLMKMLGTKGPPEARVRARMAGRAPSPGGMLTYVRVKLRRHDKEILAEPLRISGAGVLSSMVRADGILIIPEGKEGVEVGEEVEVTLLRGLE